MAANNIAVPEDILETIINLVDAENDDESLRSLALVSKSLLVPVQKHLFRRVTINPKPQNEADYDPAVPPVILTKLKEVLSVNPRLISYIQVLQLIQRQVYGPWISPTETSGADANGNSPGNIFQLQPQFYFTNYLVDQGEALAEILEMMTVESTSVSTAQARIRQLTLSSTTSRARELKGWGSLHPKLQQAFCGIFNLPTLEVVVINNIEGLPRGLFLQTNPTSERCGSLKRLELINTTFAATPENTETEGLDVTPGALSQPSRIKYLHLVPRLHGFYFTFGLDTDFLGPSTGFTLGDLEELYAGLPTSPSIPSLLEMWRREGGFQRLRKVHIDFRHYINGDSVAVWQLSSFARLSNFPVLEQLTFEGSSTINMVGIGRSSEFEWMREVVPFIEAYASLYTAAALNPDPNIAASTSRPALTNLTLAVLMLSNPSNQSYGDNDLLETVSDRLHKLYLAASSYDLQKRNHDQATLPSNSRTPNPTLNLRIELRCAFGGVPTATGGRFVTPDQEEMVLTKWKEVFDWADGDSDQSKGLGDLVIGDGQRPLEVVVLPWLTPKDHSLVSYF